MPPRRDRASRLARRTVPLAAAAVLLAGASAAPAAAVDAAPAQGSGPWHARLLGQHVVGKHVRVGGTTVGELSSIDRDPRTGAYYLIADDTEQAAAHFYTLRMGVDAHGVHGVRFVRRTWIRRTDGSQFPPLSTRSTRVADPESLRVDPANGTFYWGNEGKREDGAPLSDPSVRQMTAAGRYLRGFALPPGYRMSRGEHGPRDNLVFEGLTLTTDGRQVAASTEGALYQDGPIATVEHGAVNRITWWDKRTGRPVRQVAYRLSAIPKAPVPASASADNGISELLAVDAHRYLVVERSYASGVGNTIRVFEIDTRGATNVLHRGSLRGGGYRPVAKRLVLDLGTVGLSHLDNVEGVSWGPTLPSGERTLVFVSDDNFSSAQVTQLVAVAVRPH